MLDARDQIVVPIAHGARAHVGRVGAAARLGQRKGRQPLAAGAARQPLLALGIVAADEHGVRAQVVGADHGRGGRAGARDGHQGQQHGRGRDARAAQGLGQVHAHHAQGRQARHMAGGGQRLFVHALRQRGECVVGKAGHGIGNGVVVGGGAQSLEVHGGSLNVMGKRGPRLPCPGHRMRAARQWLRRPGPATARAGRRCARPGPVRARRGWVRRR